MKTGFDGRPAGEAFVEFRSQADALRAYNERNFSSMGNRYVELIGATAEDTFMAFGPARHGEADGYGQGHSGGGYGAAAGCGGSRVARPGPYGW